MDCLHHTPKSRKHKHLNAHERGVIAYLSDSGLSPYAIAKELDRSPNTIRNELRRGTVMQIKSKKEIHVYLPDAGQIVYDRNRLNCKRKFKLLTCSEFIETVDQYILNKKHSPDAIVGALRRCKHFNASNSVSTKTIYNYIDLGLMKTKNLDLAFKVKRSTKQNAKHQHKKILGRSIDERPLEANDRSEFGHWEIDTVIGKKHKGQSVLLTLTERKTRMEIIRRIPEKSASAVEQALNKIAKEAGPLFSKAFKSITADNGSEFSDLMSLEKTTDIKIYYAHPYTSSERGTNEHHNGLIRRFIPKGKSMNNYVINTIERIQNWCNTLPRKILSYLTPGEAFALEVKALAA
jgi:IS30 family transposase